MLPLVLVQLKTTTKFAIFVFFPCMGSGLAMTQGVLKALKKSIGLYITKGVGAVSAPRLSCY
jgi:hypothetical protein